MTGLGAGALPLTKLLGEFWDSRTLFIMLVTVNAEAYSMFKCVKLWFVSAASLISLATVGTVQAVACHSGP